MSKRKSIIACAFTMLAIFGTSHAKGWRGLVPLQSSRSDVERLLGSPKKSRGVASTYETRNERVLVYYSSGNCQNGESNGWNVPREVVISITVHPSAKLLVKDLKLDKLKYERLADDHVQGVVYYFSKEDGVRISARVLDEGEDVDSITFDPALNDLHLKCLASSVPQGTATEPEYLIQKFDEYSNISFHDERARLDNLAIHLQREAAELKAYIIVYGGGSRTSRSAQARAKRAKNYLVKARNINPARIITVEGGCSDNFLVELYALPVSVPAPTPVPYRCK